MAPPFYHPLHPWLQVDDVLAPGFSIGCQETGFRVLGPGIRSTRSIYEHTVFDALIPVDGLDLVPGNPGG